MTIRRRYQRGAPTTSQQGSQRAKMPPWTCLERLGRPPPSPRWTARTPSTSVGGAVRDLLLGRDPRELDFVVEGDAIARGARAAERSSSVRTSASAPRRSAADGATFDLARARRGALPAAGGAAGGRARRVAARGPRSARLHGQRDRAAPGRRRADLASRGARDDLEARRLRVLHDGSFADDPTRLLRLARYARGSGSQPEERTDAAGGGGDRRRRAADGDGLAARRRAAAAAARAAARGAAGARAPRARAGAARGRVRSPTSGRWRRRTTLLARAAWPRWRRRWAAKTCARDARPARVPGRTTATSWPAPRRSSRRPPGPTSSCGRAAPRAARGGGGRGRPRRRRGGAALARGGPPRAAWRSTATTSSRRGAGPAVGEALDRAMRAMLEGRARDPRSAARRRPGRLAICRVEIEAPFRWEGEHLAADLPQARALFTTRRGGVSTGPFASLNLGRLTADDGGERRREPRTRRRA